MVGYEIDQYLTQLRLYGMWVVTMTKKVHVFIFLPPLSYFNSKGGNLFKREKVVILIKEVIPMTVGESVRQSFTA